MHQNDEPAFVIAGTISFAVPTLERTNNIAKDKGADKKFLKTWLVVSQEMKDFNNKSQKKSHT